MRSFTVDAGQEALISAWESEHACGLPADPILGGKQIGAIGGEISYVFAPTSLGVILVVKCACGAELNVTDFASW
jgi:hypothetical protein